ncbi:HAMP domain-containing sensor histidine kinase [Paenibacillus chondroitinus]|uniref:histidine kinase n=1 Tax=Paenibacillus chondroitinus TaxID=59842 RepID=A0ABU6D8H6_9BACL|nr:MULTISPECIES: HAMP domain-containing sensor histidine kinase [Paenibacillus]MCY9661645.1 HAMP domain-containing histidine kinase [Paenibacillus anseongense]MEB4793730.1 HAMP domain-containing sensor histidine kinase [Paenibacillus chondroitinus]
MSIRLKLLLSYAAMLLVPLVMMMITAILLIVVFRGDFQGIREQVSSGVGLFENQNLEHTFKEMKRTSEKNPAMLADLTYLADIDQELQTNNSRMIVRKDNTFVYISPTLENSDVLQQLPVFKHPGHPEHEDAKHIGNELLEISSFDFYFSGQQSGSVFIITTVNPLVNFIQKFFPALFIMLLIILVLTHSSLTYFVSKSIISPLSKLKNAMKRIQSGDLDFQVQITSTDEIGQLSIAFEQMRKQLKESIQTQVQYEENRKELISNISHDIRTPLTAIRGYIDGLGDGIADTTDKRQKYIEIISSKAEEMDHLIDELFLFSKLDLKRVPFNFEVVNFSDFLMDWSDELEFELHKKGIHYKSEIAVDQQTLVSIDRDKIRRVFSNIVDNCLKYMNKTEKSITLQAKTAGTSVIIEIRDNGAGVEAEALPYIFDRFYRADPSRNSNNGGSGLGLAISKQMIEGHGGSISAHSMKGEWTSITIKLPQKLRKDGGNE